MSFYISLLVYNLIIRLFYLATIICALFSDKAAKWISGRIDTIRELKKIDFKNQKIIWFHFASLGEFEQGYYLIKMIKNQNSRFKILVTFFSPSGYEKISKSNLLDFVFYLPLDTKSKTNEFISIIKPKIVFIVKYEYWYNLLFNLKKNNIPVFLVSAIFLEEQIFFKFYGELHRKMLTFFSMIYTQTLNSEKLLKKINKNIQCETVGDTRFDKVLENYINAKLLNLDWVEALKDNENKILVVGSSWKSDLKVISSTFKKLKNIKLIIAPHEVTNSSIKNIKNLFDNVICLSELKHNTDLKNIEVVAIDSIGFLSRLYFYADFVFIGGGFNKKGIHNILEPAVFGKPIFIGPNYKKFNEAVELVNFKSVFSVSDDLDFYCKLVRIQNNTSVLKDLGKINKTYIDINSGACDRIMTSLYKKRFFTKDIK